LDLNDLESVKACATEFLQKESKLDVLWNNAGTGAYRVERGARTKQGMESMVGMHCVATLYFVQLLLPSLRVAAAEARAGGREGSVRVLWTASIAAESSAPPNGVDFDGLESITMDTVKSYAVSKAGNWMLAREMARRYAEYGIVSAALNPGNVRANSWEGVPSSMMFFLRPLLHNPKLAGYTSLYAGLSHEITLEKSGTYVIPWGRIQSDNESVRQDMIKAMNPEEAGGLGYAKKFWEWCEAQLRPFVG
jgi:NAD(P)-dependent dehydrogenase (short-subunit alcohol dehydrogenase family)